MKANDINNLERIRQIVCSEIGVDESLMNRKLRTKEVNQARQLIMYMGYFHGGCTYSFIGKNLGGRDHTTIMHGAATIDGHLFTDRKLKALVEKIHSKITQL